MSEKQTLTRTEAQRQAPGWRYLLGRLHLSVKFDDFVQALAFVNAIGELAEAQQHHPELDIRYSRVHVAMSSHDAGGITDRDITLATAISKLLERSGKRPDHARLTQLELAIDTMDAAKILPFWKAVLGYDNDGDDALADPDLIGPAVWFQQMDEPREIRNRIHVDVTVAHDEAESRIAAALAAGGRLVSDEAAPRFWILADADGNEACVCTWQGRDELEVGPADG